MLRGLARSCCPPDEAADANGEGRAKADAVFGTFNTVIATSPFMRAAAGLIASTNLSLADISLNGSFLATKECPGIFTPPEFVSFLRLERWNASRAL
jgi:hypothetical protein